MSARTLPTRERRKLTAHRMDAIEAFLKLQTRPQSVVEVFAALPELKLERDGTYNYLMMLVATNRIHRIEMPREGKSGSPPTYYMYGPAPFPTEQKKKLTRDGGFSGPVWRGAKEWRRRPMVDPLALPMEFFRRSA